MKTGLLNHIANASGIFISDLHILSVQFQTLIYVWDCHDYALEEWHQLILYTLHEKQSFQTEQEAKDYYTGAVLKAMLQDKTSDVNIHVELTSG